ncbi:MAG: protein kinase [Kofleriaceae bacterium]
MMELAIPTELDHTAVPDPEFTEDSGPRPTRELHEVLHEDAQRGGLGVRGSVQELDAAIAAVAPTELVHESRRREDAGPSLANGVPFGARYVIRELLGKGGMGSVHRALDLDLGVDVALKVVTTVDPDRLRDEVRLAQKVTHPNVCRTYDLETIDGHRVVKMEYIAGETVAKRIAAGGALPIGSAVTIARAIVAGLSAAHAQGIVHRDLKPGNVMLAGERTVLLDFGLAQSGGVDTDGAGTPGYMAPEQFTGVEVDERVDLYALGCVVYEMLTGERVFGTATSVELIRRHTSMPPPDVRAKRPEVRRWLAVAVSKLLAKDPAARLAGARLLVTGSRQRRRLIGAGGVAVAASVALAMAIVPGAPAWQPTIQNLDAFDENAGGPALSPDGKRITYPSDLGHPGEVAVFVSALAPASEAPRQVSPPGKRCLSPRWMSRDQQLLMTCRDGDSWRVLRRDGDASGRYTDLGLGGLVDACGDRMVVVTGGGILASGTTLVLRDPATLQDQLLVQVPNNDRIDTVRCNADGSLVAYSHTRGGEVPVTDVFIVDRERRVTQLSPKRAADDRTLTLGGAFTPDSKSVIMSLTRQGKTNLYEVPVTGGVPRQLTFGEGADLEPEVSRDGGQVIYDRDITTQPIFVIDERGQRQVTFKLGSFDRVRPVTDDVIVAEQQSSQAPKIVAITLSTGAIREIAAGRLPMISPGGTHVAFTPLGDPTVIHQVALAHGTASTVIARLPGTIVEGTSAPDGLHLMIDRQGSIEAWHVGPGGLASAEHVAGLVIPAPSGAWRAVANRDDRNNVALRFVAPDQPVGAAPVLRVAGSFALRWFDATHFGYCKPTGTCHLFDVTSQADVTAMELGPEPMLMVVGLDGKRWIGSAMRGRVTRHVITNFGERR